MSNIKKVEIPLHVGDTAEFTKTVTETDVYLFGGITADYSQMHFNEEFMKKTMYGTRIVHGILTFAIGCTASTKIQEQVKSPVPSASYGYDRLRFIKPVFFQQWNQFIFHNIAQQLVVHRAVHLLAVAGDKGDGAAVVDQLDDVFNVVFTLVEFMCQSFDDIHAVSFLKCFDGAG